MHSTPRERLTLNHFGAETLLAGLRELVASGVAHDKVVSRLANALELEQYYQEQLREIWQRERWNKRIPKRKKMLGACVYCGRRLVDYSPVMTVVDWRGKIVYAHRRCEILEQMMAGGL